MTEKSCPHSQCIHPASDCAEGCKEATLAKVLPAGGPLLPPASPATKDICNDERACAACYSDQGPCEMPTPAPDDNDFPLGQACDLSGEGGCEACQ